MKTLKWREFEAKPKPEAKVERQIQRIELWYGLDICGFKETPYSLDREDSDERGHVLWLSITRWCNVAMTRRTVDCRAVTRRTVGRGRLKVPSSGPCGRKIVLTLSPKFGSGTGLGLVCIWFPLFEARSWQEAKSNLVTVAFGKDDQIAWC
ncbi:hypothetical protein F2Q69_00019476 [Brassica cretica]|uniref:Uncharacterized protein n=1 Tax=Brassica cretica TaxID=69181 RepID=A0A8S9Q1E2_BRACR|nr:hypothetical protein F2Q69_00019476 [Brassica cretica]